MAKKATKQRKKSPAKELPENLLPQNILLVGDRVEADKNIYIHQSVYNKIHSFTKNKTVNESGGMLVGNVIEEFGKTNILITGFVEAKFCEATPTTLKFTHKTWEFIHKEIEQKHKNTKIVGWIHTHPDFGIFLSEYDQFIHQNFFSEAYQIAYVIDPIRKLEGFYFWINGHIDRCKGFYIYDKVGKTITMHPEEAQQNANPSKASVFPLKNALIGVLAAAVILLSCFSIHTVRQLSILEAQQEALKETIAQQEDKIQELTDALKNSATPSEATR